jgi:hypothetical protein
MYEVLRRNIERQWATKKQSCGPLEFYARRTQGLNRIFALAFFIKRKDLRCDPGKATAVRLLIKIGIGKRQLKAASSCDSITHHGTSRHRHVHPAQRQQNTLGDRSSPIKETTTTVGATTPFKIPNPKNSLGFTTTSYRDRATGAFIVVLDRPQRPLLIGGDSNASPRIASAERNNNTSPDRIHRVH